MCTSETHGLLGPFVALNRRLGANLLFTQGTGGNSSVKLDDDRLIIKASGCRLRELTASQGWAIASARTIRQGLKSLDASDWVAGERGYQTLLMQANLGPARTISIESHLHALLSERWVVHLHSIVGQWLALLPAEQAMAKVAKVLGSGFPLYFIPAAAPGLDLSAQILQVINAQADAGAGDSLWLLRNHGLAWTSASPDRLQTLINQLEIPLQKELELERYGLPKVTADTEPGVWTLDFSAWPRCDMDLQPSGTDFVIHNDLWSKSPANLAQTDARVLRLWATSPAELAHRLEVIYAHALVSTMARQSGSFAALPAPIVRRIKDLKLEAPAKKEESSPRKI